LSAGKAQQQRLTKHKPGPEKGPGKLKGDFEMKKWEIIKGILLILGLPIGWIIVELICRALEI
jgi:hypothetical protein